MASFGNQNRIDPDFEPWAKGGAFTQVLSDCNRGRHGRQTQLGPVRGLDSLISIKIARHPNTTQDILLESQNRPHRSL